MVWFYTGTYLFFGILWAEMIKEEATPYYEYVYHALFWPVSVIVYFIGRLNNEKLRSKNI